MLIALMADLHANREAFAACLDHAERQGAQRLVFLGDVVGYGADPEWVTDTVIARVARGAVAVLGNHDQAVGRGTCVSPQKVACASVACRLRRASSASST